MFNDQLVTFAFELKETSLFFLCKGKILLIPYVMVKYYFILFVFQVFVETTFGAHTASPVTTVTTVGKFACFYAMSLQLHSLTISFLCPQIE